MGNPNSKLSLVTKKKKKKKILVQTFGYTGVPIYYDKTLLIVYLSVPWYIIVLLYFIFKFILISHFMIIIQLLLLLLLWWYLYSILGNRSIRRW